LLPLIPELPAEGWRPPAKASATEGLPPLEQAAQHEKPLQEQVMRDIQPEKETVQEEAGRTVQHLQSLHLHFQHQNRLHQQIIADLEKELNRPLDATEKSLVWQATRKPSTSLSGMVRPEYLGLLAIAPEASLPAALPWGALGLNGHPLVPDAVRADLLGPRLGEVGRR
jgi:hypothetical protein